MDLCAPIGAKPVGDLAEDDGGSDLPLGNIVGGRDSSVGQENEELGAPRLDLTLQNLSGGMGGGDGDQSVEAPFGFRRIGGQGAILQVRSSLAALEQAASQRQCDRNSLIRVAHRMLTPIPT